MQLRYDGKMNKLFRAPVLASLCHPEQIACEGLDRCGIKIHGREDMYGKLSDFKQIGQLYTILNKVFLFHDWQDYFKMERMHFQWRFNGQIISSCNPFVELFFRCTRALMVMFNGVVHNRLQVDQVELEKLVTSLNMAVRGSISAVPYGQGDICVPGLTSPPHLRESHRHAFNATNIEVVPSISTHLLQFTVYMLLVETWLQQIGDDTYQMLVGGTLYPRRVMQNIEEAHSNIKEVVSAIFSSPKSPMHLEEFREYMEWRFCNESSDLSKCLCIAKYVQSNSSEAEKERVIDSFESYQGKIQTSLYHLGVRCPTKLHPVGHTITQHVLFMFKKGLNNVSDRHTQSDWFIDNKSFDIEKISDHNEDGINLMAISVMDSCEYVSPDQPLLEQNNTQHQCCCRSQ